MDEREQLRRAKDFVRRVMIEMWDGMMDVDGGFIQEWGITTGVIVPVVATMEDAERLDECEAGDTIYKFSEWMREPEIAAEMMTAPTTPKTDTGA